MSKLLIFDVNLPTAKESRNESKLRAGSEFTVISDSDIIAIRNAIVRSCKDGLTGCRIPLWYLNRNKTNDYIRLLKAGGYKVRLSFWGVVSKYLIIKW